jgi:O-antigen ligase
LNQSAPDLNAAIAYPKRMDPRTKIAGSFGIAFGFFAGTGVSGLAMALSLAGIWGLIYGLLARDHSLDKAFLRALKSHGWVWLALVLFVSWSLLTALWSPATELAGESVRRLGALSVLGPIAIWAVHSCQGSDRVIAQRGIVAGIFLSLLLLGFDTLNHYAMNKIASPGKADLAIDGDMGRAATATLTLVWVGYACLHQQLADPRARAALALLAVVIALQYGTDLNAIGLLAGTMAALFALRFPKTAIGLVCGGSAILMAGAPIIYAVLAKITLGLAPEGQLPLSYGRRAQMWEVAVQLIEQKPMAGWGLGAMSLFDRPIIYGGLEWPLIQLHPHAAPLHIWVETGGIGAFLAAITMVLAGGAAIQVFGRYRVATAALVGGLTFLALSWGFSHAAWREWVWTSFAALLAFSFVLRNPRRWGLRMQAKRAI